MADLDGHLAPPPLSAAAPEAVAVYGSDGSFQGADREFIELLGLDEAADELHSLSALLEWLQPRLREGELPNAERLDLHLDLPSDLHAEIEGSGQRPLDVHLRSLSPLGNGKVISLRDRGEHERLQQRAHQAQKMEAVGRLVGGISHDFNNLLTVIRGYCDFSKDQLRELDAGLLLGQKAQCATLRRSIDEITNASSRASELTRQLLAYSRQQVVSPQLMDLNLELREIEKMLERLLGEDVTLHREVRLQPATVRADRGQMHQMIMNLVINARDALPDGGHITLRTEAFSVDEAFAARFDYPVELGEKVMLRVIDDGAGINPDVLPHIFEPFFTTKDIGRGTGLGLSTVYGIIKQSRGNIWVDSTPGQGTEFRICLPLEQGNVHRHPTPASTTAPSRGQRILIVDDQQPVRQVIAQLLQNAGYRALAATPREALDAQSAGERFDLLVTDLMMAEMDGTELARRLSGSQPGLPVLYISGYDPDAYKRRGVLPEGAFFLAKPLDAETLQAKISQILELWSDGGPTPADEV